MKAEPEAAVLSIFERLIDNVKQAPSNEPDNGLTGSMVYSQLVLGMPIAPADYLLPWAPPAGASLADKPVPPLLSDPTFMKAMQAAWRTALLGRTLLQVTTDGAYREYPPDRHLDFAYEALLDGMRTRSRRRCRPK
jgi:hypothetical protein